MANFYVITNGFKAIDVAEVATELAAELAPVLTVVSETLALNVEGIANGKENFKLTTIGRSFKATYTAEAGTFNESDSVASVSMNGVDVSSDVISFNDDKTVATVNIPEVDGSIIIKMATAQVQ